VLEGLHCHIFGMPLMQSRRPSPNSRAKTDESKRDVRDAFISVGRHLFAIEDPSQVSLRRIAAEAGYSPGTIYKYFRDQHELFIAIREEDMARVVDDQERIAKQTTDPEERVRKVFLRAARHWLSHPDQFRVLFAIRPGRTATLSSNRYLFRSWS
jgi:AcrR family transcriptional regulator